MTRWAFIVTAAFSRSVELIHWHIWRLSLHSIPPQKIASNAANDASWQDSSGDRNQRRSELYWLDHHRPGAPACLKVRRQSPLPEPSRPLQRQQAPHRASSSAARLSGEGRGEAAHRSLAQHPQAQYASLILISSSAFSKAGTA